MAEAGMRSRWSVRIGQGILLLALVFWPRVGAAEGVGEPGTPDPHMQKAIDAAVAKGTKLLKSKQNENGSFGGIQTHSGVHFAIGTTSLAGLALLAAGEAKGDASVDRVLAYVQEKDRERGASGGHTTYDSGVLLMFLTEYYRAKEKAPAGKGKAKPGKGAKKVCQLPEEAARWVQDVADALVRSRKEPGTWGYPQPSDDLSNTQHALLGLRAARDCGAAVPPAVFEQAMSTLLARQERDGPTVPRVVFPAGPGEKPYAEDLGDRARGWSYHQEPFRSTGSMTAAGIASLAICHDALTRPDRSSMYSEQGEHKVRRAVQDGFSWLDRLWTMDRNPGVDAPNWHLYYLRTVEEACRIGGRSLVGTHDWYLEGAAKLLAMQQEDGRWSTGVMGKGKDYQANDFCDTAWAILFLKRSTRPLAPIPLP